MALRCVSASGCAHAACVQSPHTQPLQACTLSEPVAAFLPFSCRQAIVATALLLDVLVFLPRITGAYVGGPERSAAALIRVRGGSDLWQPTLPADGSCDASTLGRLHVLWFPARRNALKGAVVAILVAARLRLVQPGGGVLSEGGSLWLCARLFYALLAGLLARALDWKLLVALLLAARHMGHALRASGAVPGSALGGVLDMTRWAGGTMPELRDKVL